MGRKPRLRRSRYGAWLYHLRKERNLSQAELSQLTGIPQTTITRWERHGLIGGRNEIIAMAKALQVPIAKLLRVEKYGKD